MDVPVARFYATKRSNEMSQSFGLSGITGRRSTPRIIVIYELVDRLGVAWSTVASVSTLRGADLRPVKQAPLLAV